MSDEIRRAVGVLAPDGVVEVRALADGATHSGYFDDYEALAQAVEALDADPAVAGIYVTLNTVNPALLARRANRIKMRLGRKDATTADADILGRRWLPVDIDPVRPSGVSSTDEEHAAALDAAGRIAAYLAEQGFGDPVRADSGNGAHLLYRIDLPNDEAATEVVKGALATLDALFSNDVITVDTANYNAARIWKLYGTMSRKGDSTPERPHRRAKILAAPPEMKVVPLERLQHLAELFPRDEPAPRRKGGSIDLALWLAEHGLAVRVDKTLAGRDPLRSCRVPVLGGAPGRGVCHPVCERRHLRRLPSRKLRRGSPAVAGTPGDVRAKAEEKAGGEDRDGGGEANSSLSCTLPPRMSTATVPSRSSVTATRSPSSSTPSTKPTSATGPSRSLSRCRSPPGRSRTQTVSTSPSPATPGRARPMPARRCRTSSRRIQG
jgi:hypothetical protein